MFYYGTSKKKKFYYVQVGHLVVSNADYIIDSLCRQLRHLDLNPHIPGVLSAMLSYVGAANEILPLLEEPVIENSKLSFNFFIICIVDSIPVIKQGLNLTQTDEYFS